MNNFWFVNGECFTEAQFYGHGKCQLNKQKNWQDVAKRL